MNLYEKKEIFIQKKEFIRDLEYILYKKKQEKYFSEMVFLCIGTDKVIGDSVGPLVGTKLKELLNKYNFFNINIYGSLDKTINYSNIIREVKNIEEKHKNACIIVVDAALSKKENIGKIFVASGKTLLGKSLNKSKIEIGDISIKIVVGRNYKFEKYNLNELQSSSLYEIINLSNIVANGIYEVIKYV